MIYQKIVLGMVFVVSNIYFAISFYSIGDGWKYWKIHLCTVLWWIGFFGILYNME